MLSWVAGVLCGVAGVARGVGGVCACPPLVGRVIWVKSQLSQRGAQVSVVGVVQLLSWENVSRSRRSSFAVQVAQSRWLASTWASQLGWWVSQWGQRQISSAASFWAASGGGVGAKTYQLKIVSNKLSAKQKGALDQVFVQA